ncbi:hypothetical protein UlMin_011220 [Ulmus minor]
MFSGVESPVNVAGREDEAAQPSSEHDDRTAVNVLDFLSGKGRLVKDHDDSKAITVKKEKYHGAELGVNIGLHLLTTNTGSDQSTLDDGISSNVEDRRLKTELAQLKIELERMNTENKTLKHMLSQVSNNYNALHMHLTAIMQQQLQKAHGPENVEEKFEEKQEGEAVVARQFLDLRRSETDNEVSNSTSDERTRSATPQNMDCYVKNKEKSPFDQDDRKHGREESPESESQAWNPNKLPKLNSSKPMDQQSSPSSEATMRKARVSVRARSEAPMITDGCQWRKYGQKMAKGNPCPRAYYRCTMAVACPVRKQVQRCAEDRTILITTYEGNHNHPLPPAAMAMASTTTAAANMLLSGSMSSADGIMNPNLLARAILPNSSSMATISASAPFPTVTLDLTNNSNPLQFQRPTSSQFQVPFHGIPQNFESASTPSLPQVFGQSLYNQSKFSGLQISGQEAGSSSSQLSQQGSLPQLHPSSFADKLSAATAAITSDPNFREALAAAISTIIGGAQPNNNTTATATATNNNNKSNSFSGN